MDEREVSGALELGVNDLLPISGILKLTFSRRWKARADQFTEATAQAAGLTIDQLAEAVIENDELGDLFVRSTQRANASFTHRRMTIGVILRDSLPPPFLTRRSLKRSPTSRT